MSKVCILYGLGEGRLIANKFVKQLEASGYKLTPHLAEADIVIAHSGGCFLIPPDFSKKVILVNIPYWPGRNVFYSLFNKILKDLVLSVKNKNLTYFMKKTFFNSIYILNMKQNLSLFRGRQRGDLWRVNDYLVVRNKDDDFCSPVLSYLPFKAQNITIELPGLHDDLWLNPTSYIDPISKLLPR